MSRIFLVGGKSTFKFPIHYIKYYAVKQEFQRVWKKNWKFWRGGRVNEFGIQRAWKVKRFGISKGGVGGGGLKCSCCPW